MLKRSLRYIIIKINFVSKITLRESNFSYFRYVFYIIESYILKRLRYNKFNSYNIVLTSYLLYRRYIFDIDN